MTRAHLIYPLDKRIESELKKTRADSLNGDILIRFYKVRSCEMTKASMLIYLIRLNQISKMLKKRFDKATIEDIENLVFAIEQTDLAKSTKNRTRRILKGFYRWLKKCAPGQFPPEVSWIVTKKMPIVTVKIDDLIPFEDCVKITECATNLRDRALFQCQLDAGCRIGEILTVKVGEVSFNDYGAVLNSDGKTGEAPLILTWSSGTLTQWLNIHPFRDNKESPLFPKLGRATPQQLPYSGALSAFKKCVKKAGFENKRVWLHLFKHVSCTYDSFRGMPQSYRNYKHHWSANSEMNKVYEHLSNSIIPKIQSWDKTSENIQESESIVLVEKCKRCEFENPRKTKYCNRCSFPLNDIVSIENMMKRKHIETLIDKLAEDPENLKRLLSIIG